MTQPAQGPAEATEHPSPPSFPQEALRSASFGLASLKDVQATLTDRAKPYLQELKDHGFPDTAFQAKDGEVVRASYNHHGDVTRLTASESGVPGGNKDVHQYDLNPDGTVRNGTDYDKQGNGLMLLESDSGKAIMGVSTHDGPNGQQRDTRVDYDGNTPRAPEDMTLPPLQVPHLWRFP
jgi:hypothetical protein